MSAETEILFYWYEKLYIWSKLNNQINLDIQKFECTKFQYLKYLNIECGFP